jgi:hypothetical protein
VAQLDRRYEAGLASRKSVPRGYDASHPRTRYLLHEGLVAILEGPLPPDVSNPAFAETCLAHFRAVGPINEWLASILRR